MSNQWVVGPVDPAKVKETLASFYNSIAGLTFADIITDPSDTMAIDIAASQVLESVIGSDLKDCTKEMMALLGAIFTAGVTVGAWFGQEGKATVKATLASKTIH